MQIYYASCFVLAALIAKSNVDADSKSRLVNGRDDIRGIAKREISLLVDNFPSESNVNNINQKVIYSRISKQRYRGPKSKHTQSYKYRPLVPKYGPPTPKYNPPPTKRRPQIPSKSKWNAKKYKRNHLKTVKGPAAAGLRYNSDPRPSKGKLGNKNKARKQKPMPPPKVTHSAPFQSPEPTGFGEPPAEAHLTSYNDSPRPTGSDVPIDSYGNVLQNQYIDHQNDPLDAKQQLLHNEYPPNGQPENPHYDSSFAYSHNHQTVVIPPGPAFFDTDDYAIDANSEISNHKDKDDIPKKIREKDTIFYNKLVNKPWTKDNEIIVGGQYAEPPARYIPKFQPSAPMIAGSEEFTPYNGIVEEFGSSATVSPYVNYKNTNMAFSPQNLNDAFSIVDK